MSKQSRDASAGDWHELSYASDRECDIAGWEESDPQGRVYRKLVSRLKVLVHDIPDIGWGFTIWRRPILRMFQMSAEHENDEVWVTIAAYASPNWTADDAISAANDAAESFTK